MKRAVFLDRDGTIIEEKDYLHKPEDVVFFPGTIAALKKIAESDLLLFLVTNQSGVGRGFFTLADVEKVHAYINALLAAENVHFTKIYVAAEHPDAPSHGRKPSPQFLWDARDEFGLDLAQSYMVGDKLIDLQCGWNAGVKRSVLVRTGYGNEVEKKNATELRDALIVNTIVDAAEWICCDAIK